MKKLLIALLVALPALTFGQGRDNTLNGKIRRDPSNTQGGGLFMPADSIALKQVQAGLLTRVTRTYVNTYAQAVAVAPQAGLTIEIVVRNDENRGGGRTMYNLEPNGDRYLTAFLIQKDN